MSNGMVLLEKKIDVLLCFSGKIITRIHWGEPGNIPLGFV